MKIPILIDVERFIRRLFKHHKNKNVEVYKDPNIMQANLSTVIIDISYFCNAQCPFCPRQILEPKLSGFMSKEIFYESMRQIEQIPSVTNITLAAEGEPLMHPDFDEFVDYIKSKGYSIAFPTNMGLAHKHFEAMSKCDCIMYSIEGHDKESYEEFRKNLNFEQTLKNVKDFHDYLEAKKAKGEKVPYTHINLILFKDSKPQEFLDTWAKYVDAVRIDPVMPVVNYNPEKCAVEPAYNEKFRNRMLELSDAKVKKCIQPFILTVIKPDGKMGICCSDYNISLDFGDYRNIKENFENNPNLVKIRNEFNNNAVGVCEKCLQHTEVKKDVLFQYFPDLKDIEAKYENVTIYESR